MLIYDYSRSFVTFTTRGRGNNARLQIESVCNLTDKTSGQTTEYVFFASCKSEDTFAKSNLFYEDNYDFCGIFASEEYAIFRTKSTHTDGFRETGLWKNRFENVHFQLVKQTGHMLETPADIVQSTLKGIPIIGRVEIGNESFSAVLEFPIKTMNVNDIQNLYQIDTGPIAFPDFDITPTHPIERLSPAYVAYNAPHFADFVIQQPLAIHANSRETIQVTHYSKRVSLPAQTHVFAGS